MIEVRSHQPSDYCVFTVCTGTNCSSHTPQYDPRTESDSWCVRVHTVSTPLLLT